MPDSFDETTRLPTTNISAFGATKIGTGRNENQDRYLIESFGTNTKGSFRVFVIADGMGGEACGAKASQIVIETVRDFFSAPNNYLSDRTDDELLSLVADCAMDCDRQVLKYTDNCPESEGMGATLTLALIVEGTLYCAHVGDTRCYLLRNDQFVQLTHDQTAAEAIKIYFDLGPSENRKLGHVLLNVINGRLKRENIELCRLPLEPGDELLMSSDGIHDRLDRDSIAKIIGVQSREHQCHKLIDEAEANGSTDDRTAILICVE